MVTCIPWIYPVSQLVLWSATSPLEDEEVRSHAQTLEVIIVGLRWTYSPGELKKRRIHTVHAREVSRGEQQLKGQVLSVAITYHYWNLPGKQSLKKPPSPHVAETVSMVLFTE
jgi:hypothetical protein